MWMTLPVQVLLNLVIYCWSMAYICIQWSNTHTLGHTLDLVITRSTSDIKDITHQDPLISDHELISFSIKSQDPETKLQLKKNVYRRYKTLGLDNFCADIFSSDELNIPISTDRVTLLESYERILTSLLKTNMFQNVLK